MLAVLLSVSARRYAKVKSMFVFAGDLDGLRRWGRNIGMSQPSSRGEGDQSIRDVLEAKQRESAPADLPREQGWVALHRQGLYAGPRAQDQ